MMYQRLRLIVRKYYWLRVLNCRRLSIKAETLFTFLKYGHQMRDLGKKPLGQNRHARFKFLNIPWRASSGLRVREVKLTTSAFYPSSALTACRSIVRHISDPFYIVWCAQTSWKPVHSDSSGVPWQTKRTIVDNEWAETVEFGTFFNPMPHQPSTAAIFLHERDNIC